MPGQTGGAGDPSSDSTGYAISAGGLPGAAILRHADSSLVQARSIDRDFINGYRQLKAFNYEHPRDPRSLWDRIVDWLNEVLEDILPRPAAQSITAFLDSWLPYIILVGGAGVAAWKLYRTRLQGFFGKGDRGFASDMSRIEENLGAVDLDALVSQAAAEGRYRHAVRLLYLRSLRDLADRNLIDYRRERTNAEYVRDLADVRVRFPFERITLLFEHIWYGDLQIDRKEYPVVAAAFDQFCVQLSEVVT